MAGVLGYPRYPTAKDMSFQNLVAKVEAERREQERLSEVKKKDGARGRLRRRSLLAIILHDANLLG